jgi:hypothetical protein
MARETAMDHKAWTQQLLDISGLTTDRISSRPLALSPAIEVEILPAVWVHPTIARAWFMGDVLRPIPDEWLADGTRVQWHDHHGHNTGSTDGVDQGCLRKLVRDGDGMFTLFPECDLQVEVERCRGCYGCGTCGGAPPSGFICGTCGAT